MAQLAVSFVGAAIGGFFGGPVGAQIGFALGSLVGGVLFPTPPSQIEGPRLGEIQGSANATGSPIRLGYGTMKMGGSPIWMSEVREVEHRNEIDGGFLGPDTVQITYTYHADVAVLFSAGPADDIVRLWFNNTIVYDNSIDTVDYPDFPAGSLASVKISSFLGSSFKFKIYKGDETQLPDPTIEAAEGVGEVSANRGLVYVVFENLNLTEYGNSLPKIDAEVAFSATQTTTDRFSDELTTGEGGVFTSVDSDGLAIDHRRRRIYLRGGGASGSGIRVYNMDTLSEIRQVLISDILTNTSFPSAPISSESAMHVGDSGIIYVQVGSNNARPVVTIDPDTLEVLSTFGSDGPGTGLSGTGAVNAWPAVDHITELPLIPLPVGGSAGADGIGFVAARKLLNNGEHLYVASVNTRGQMAHRFEDTTNLDAIIGIVALRPKVNLSSGYVCTQATANGDINIYRLEMGSGAEIILDSVDQTRTFVGSILTLVGTITAATWSTDGDGTAAVTIDKRDEGLIFVISRNVGTGSTAFKWIEDTGVVWTSDVSATSAPLVKTSFANGSNVDSGFFGWVDSGEDGALIDTSDGEVIESGFDWASLTASANVLGQMIFDGPTKSVISIHSGAPGVLGQLILNRVSGNATTDGAIVSDVASRLGYDTLSEINVSEITNVVQGYAVTRNMPGRSAIQPLGTAFNWDAVESDGKLVFKARGRASLKTILDSDMIPIGSEGDSTVIETRIQEVELPESVTVTHMDQSLDYSIGAQSSKRILSPDPTMRSQNKADIPLPLVISADEARQISERVLFSSWNERTSYKWKTDWSHLELDPGDVVTLSLEGPSITTTARVRIADVQMGADLALEFSGFKEEETSFVSTATGATHPNFPRQIIPGPSFTRLFLLDIPLITDLEDSGRKVSRLHIAMNGYSLNWPGGVLYASTDGAIFDNAGVKNVSGANFGTVINKLPKTDTPFQTDTDTQLKVLMNDGELSSITQTEFLDNTNIAAIGSPDLNNWEIILFKNATLNVDGTYTLDTLIRGKRGTEVNANSHSNGEFFFVLDAAGITSYALAISLLQVNRFYKGVGFGQFLEDAEIKSLASNMNDLKPYAPVHLDAVVDGGNNIDISWVRRTRVGGDEPENGSDDLPVSEDSESYEIDIGYFDDHYDDTVLIVTANGADAATTTTDFSAAANVLTFGPNGEAELDTAQFQFGTSSIKFANSGSTDPADSFVSAPNTNFQLASDPFTLETWIRFNTTAGDQVFMSLYRNVGDDRCWWIEKDTGGDLQFNYTTDGLIGTQVTVSGAWSPSINTWYHIAVTRDENNDIRLFIDGVLITTQNVGNDIIFRAESGNALFFLGKFKSNNDLPLDGWMDDIRVTRNYARYTDINGFTPMQIAESEEGDVVRALTSTTQSVQYDNADIVTDFGGVPSDIQIRAYQMSAQVGRGNGTTLKKVF